MPSKKPTNKKTKSTSKVIEFPYSSFPIKVVHKEGNDTKTCWFQCEDHYLKYIVRNKLKKGEYEVYTNGVDLVGESTRRKSTRKQSSSRQSSNS